jgi:hypothetical protein
MDDAFETALFASAALRLAGEIERDRQFESLYPSKRLLAGRHCRLAEPGRPIGSSPRILCFEHLEGTCTPAGRPRRKSRGRLRLEPDIQTSSIRQLLKMLFSIKVSPFTSGCQRVPWRMKNMIGRTASSISFRSICHTSFVGFAGSLSADCRSISAFTSESQPVYCVTTRTNNFHKTACRGRRRRCPRSSWPR